MYLNPSLNHKVRFAEYKRGNLESIGRMIIRSWYWLLFALFLGLAMGHLYLLSAPKYYSTNALLKFEEKKSEISELINIRNVYDRTNKIESEKSNS